MSTNESATAALKDMLGIGGGILASPFTPEKLDSPPSIEGNNTSNKKSNKKDRDNSAKKPKLKQPTPNVNKGSGQMNPLSTKKKVQPESKPTTENFAWSAFQASPDASVLPFPAFISPSLAAKPIISEITDLDSDKLTALLSNVSTRESAAPQEISNALRAEDFEAQMIAAAQRQAAIERTDETESAHLEVATNAEAELVNAGGINLAALEPVSGGGINLAALASSPLMSKEKSAALTPDANLGSTPMALFHSPQQHQQQYHQFTSPQHQQQFIPHGYMTIQVQVPPYLMPGRCMVVHSPSGFPVQVIVPEGIPPGMVIPVLVPASPSHMMPPPQQYAQQYGMQQPYNNRMPSPHL